MMNDERRKKDPSDLRERTKTFALRVLKLCASLPKSKEAELIRWQLLKSGTSVGAHYREAVRARSTAEFISKMEGGLQELEESIYWLELLVDGKIMPGSLLQGLMDEGNELVAILFPPLRLQKGVHSAVPHSFIIPHSEFIVSYAFDAVELLN